VSDASENTPVSLRALAFADLNGWHADNHADALAAFSRSCVEMMERGHGFKRAAAYAGERSDWTELAGKSSQATNAKSFFEHHFVPIEVTDPIHPSGLLTGYFEPEAEGSREPSVEYTVPLYAKPTDLVAFNETAQEKTGLRYGRLENGTPQAYFTRQEIETGALKGQGLELVWLKDWADAFFIHIQGSGRVRLTDGNVLRLSYAAKSGLPYTGIGRVLIERGALTPETSAMQTIRAWLKANPHEARQMLWNNKSFVFFRVVEVSDPTLGGLGAQQVHLTPRRSLAVDRSLWGFGTPIWVETSLPPEARTPREPFHHLLIAQDTGSAIKGHARGDVYWGWGDDAAVIAGHMKSNARIVVLLPKVIAARHNLLR
jgi:membrane-bound lytic murein transglycosylase A